MANARPLTCTCRPVPGGTSARLATLTRSPMAPSFENRRKFRIVGSLKQVRFYNACTVFARRAEIGQRPRQLASLWSRRYERSRSPALPRTVVNYRGGGG